MRGGNAGNTRGGEGGRGKGDAVFLYEKFGQLWQVPRRHLPAGQVPPLAPAAVSFDPIPHARGRGAGRGGGAGERGEKEAQYGEREVQPTPLAPSLSRSRAPSPALGLPRPIALSTFPPTALAPPQPVAKRCGHRLLDLGGPPPSSCVIHCFSFSSRLLPRLPSRTHAPTPRSPTPALRGSLGSRARLTRPSRLAHGPG